MEFLTSGVDGSSTIGVEEIESQLNVVNLILIDAHTDVVLGVEATALGRRSAGDCTF